MFNHFEKTLGNGLKVILVPTGTTSVVADLIVGTGANFETKATRGISHFLEHMAFKGTKKRPSNIEFSQELDKIGAAYDAGTSREYTVYYIKNTAVHLDLMLDMLADMVFNGKLEQQEIERERGVIIEEFNTYEDTPYEKVGDNFISLVFGDNSLGWPILGTKENIRNFKREDFVNYKDRYYQPENMVLVIAGGVKEENKEKIFNQVEKWFGRFENKPVEKMETKVSTDEKRLDLETKETEQTHLVLGVPTMGWEDDNRWSLAVLARILGGGMSSRLFQQVRHQRGLAYYINSWYFLVKQIGLLGVSAGATNQQVQLTIDLIKKELLEFEQTVTEKEVADAKEGILGKLMLSLEKPETIASVFGKSSLLEGKIRTPEQAIGKIKRISLKKIQQLAKDLFREESLYLSAIGPDKDLKI